MPRPYRVVTAGFPRTVGSGTVDAAFAAGTRVEIRERENLVNIYLERNQANITTCTIRLGVETTLGIAEFYNETVTFANLMNPAGGFSFAEDVQIPMEGYLHIAISAITGGLGSVTYSPYVGVSTAQVV